MLILPPTKENKILAECAASFAIEDIYFSKEFLLEVLKIATEEITIEESIKQTIDRHEKAPPE